MSDDIDAPRRELMAAEADLQSWWNRWKAYRGDNPDKYRKDIKLAHRRLVLAKAKIAAMAGGD